MPALVCTASTDKFIGSKAIDGIVGRGRFMNVRKCEEPKPEEKGVVDRMLVAWK
jgi:hypothetical protein